MRSAYCEIHHRIGMALAGLLLALPLAGSAWGETSSATTAATAATVVSGGTLTATTPTDCVTCHGAGVVASHHDTTDPNSLFNQGLCSQCHVGITTSGDCTTCHTATGLNNKHHIPPTGQTSVDCAQCHTGAGDLRNCGSCHQGDAPRATHHNLAAFIDPVTQKRQCAPCHPGASLTSDCRQCHNATTGVEPRAQHHNYTLDTAGNKPACTACHTKLAPTGNCQGCHAPRAEMPEHHALTGAPAYMSCGFCHTGLASGPKETRSGCNACHATANLPLHHDKVRTERSLACNQCHETAVAVSGCESCHVNGTTPTSKAIHHDTTAGTPYASGNCGACHTSTGFVRSNCNSIACHPALSPTSGARHHQADVITKYPVFQSSSNPGSADCSICHFYSIAFVNGSFVSTVIPPPAEDCIFCHERTINRGDVQIKHHNTTATTSGNCGLCHSGVTTSGGACATCHSATSSKPATPQTHHDAATANGTPCADCHKGISPSASCADCHTTTSGNDSSRHHLFKNSQNQLYACNTCHTGATNIYQSCKGCHESLSGGATAAVYHHMTTVYTTGPCATCHKTTDGTSLLQDCASCHLGAGKPSIATRHHETVSYDTGQCESCHSNTAPASIPCAGCHTGTASMHHSQTVTVGTTVTPKPCKDCHSTIQLIGGNCAGCHTEPIPQIHHGDPLTAVNGNCAVCHQSVSSPSSCSTCHTTTTHHTTTWSQTGDCAHCHLVPAAVADRPAQAACRECHGTKMHDKGGPIQNYGACAACHSTKPYHAAPLSPPGYLGYGAGKGKFNIFLSQNAGEHGDSNDIRPNGEDLRDEDGKKYLATQITYSTKRITYTGDGKYYTVPYFTGMATGNLALKKTASASGSESGYGASLAVDGNVATRWWRKSTSTQTLTVDLGTSKSIAKVTIRWYSYYAKAYQVQASTSSSGPWTTVASTTAGAGGAETKTFTARSARYVRIYCQTASSYNGYSINELEVYAP